MKQWITLLLALSGPVLANESCGMVNATAQLPSGQWGVRLAKHNDQQLMPSNITASAANEVGQSRFMALALQPGWHKLQGYVVCIPPFGNAADASGGSYCANKSVGGSSADRVDFYIHVEKDQLYRLAAKRLEPRSLIPGKRFEVVVESARSKPCEAANPKAALSRPPKPVKAAQQEIVMSN
ncbi:hypothetical protein [Gallaecimonas mangrovi]|uniref:hypothetical protein n=1 Tax=Gallaecimonas mangrovi TaxID=2291597 RepID=UPI000E2005D6|nr:hypothetical protein [Gallaecimonas mangrovi]